MPKRRISAKRRLRNNAIGCVVLVICVAVIGIAGLFKTPSASSSRSASRTPNQSTLPAATNAPVADTATEIISTVTDEPTSAPVLFTNTPVLHAGQLPESVRLTEHPATQPTVQATTQSSDQAFVVEDRPEQTYYATATLIVRRCASRTCPIAGNVQAGQAILVDGEAQGEAVATGNPVWYRIRINGEENFVYSAWVSDTAPTVNSSGGSSGGTTGGGGGQVNAQPGNCSTAVAMGLTAQQAAAAGLDRDGDGEACYGN